MRFKYFKKTQIKRLVLIFFISFFSIWLFINSEEFPGHEGVRVLLIEKLTKNETLKGHSYDKALDSNNIIYVLGGWQGSLESRFRIAADLYHKGLCRKILFLSMPGITEYDSKVGRNLTNDEWAIKMLMHFGVKREDIEPVILEKRFFGTFTEAEGVANLVSTRGHKHLILITSSYHALRTLSTFSGFVNNYGITPYMYAIDEPIGLPSVLMECFKFIFYRGVLLPIYKLR